MKRKRKVSKTNINLSEERSPYNISLGNEANPPWVASNYSQQTLKVEEKGDLKEFLYTSKVNLTISLKLSEFSRKQACLLASQAIFLVLEEGMVISDWYILSFLYNYILGNKEQPEEIDNKIAIELAQLLRIILLSCDFLSNDEKVRIPGHSEEIIRTSKLIPDKRAFESRKQSYDLKKFLKIRIVPIDILFDKNLSGIPYSSYCKGYGESNSSARKRGKTSYSSELDGEAYSDKKLETFPLSLFVHFSNLIFEETNLRIKRRDRKR